MHKHNIIEKINILGPWVHGYFELPNGITIRDGDEFHKDRLFQLRQLFVEIISSHYKKNKLADKTLCDVGCNAGYFLLELFRSFEFLKAKGFDPRKSNINKANFIAKQFNLPKDRFSIEVGDLFDNKKRSFDVVIMPGVLHHLDDHILACKRLYDMTNELLIIETMGLPDAVENSEVSDRLELKDDVYKSVKPIFGVCGMKLESNYLDGAAATSGIVTIPSKHAVYLALFNAGFREIKVFDLKLNQDQNQPRYREFVNLVAIAVKPKLADSDFFEEHTRVAQYKEIDEFVPRSLIEPLYRVVCGDELPQNLTGEAREIWFEIIRCEKTQQINQILANKPYFAIVKSFIHQPLDKIRFEFAKTLFKQGEIDRSRRILLDIVRTLNADWRSVYRSYHILSLISISDKKLRQARSYCSKALKTHPKFSPALALKDSLKSMSIKS